MKNGLRYTGTPKGNSSFFIHNSSFLYYDVRIKFRIAPYIATDRVQFTAIPRQMLNLFETDGVFDRNRWCI